MEGGVYVNNTLFNKEGHLTEEVLKILKFDRLRDEELIFILEHISACEECAGAFADSFKENELTEAPSGFQEKVQIRIKDKKRRNIQFNFYCVKVAVAASIALMMVFSNGLNSLANSKANYVKPPDLSVLNSVNANLNNFSEKIIKLEVFINDKEKK
nr:hypothetical protein [Clostridium chromiireducens]